MRKDFETLYTAVSCEEADPTFDLCECCELPGAVLPARWLASTDIKKEIFDKIYEGELCQDCLVYLINGEG